MADDQERAATTMSKMRFIAHSSPVRTGGRTSNSGTA